MNGPGYPTDNIIMLILHVQVDPYCPTVMITITSKQIGDLNFDLQGHPRSKVMVSNESLIMFSNLTLIVTICLTCSVSEIWYPKGF